MLADEDLSLRAADEVRQGCFCFRARRTARAITRLYDQALRPLGIEAPQLTLLSAVGSAGQGGQRAAALADSLVMDPTTLSRNLKQLERIGWVRVDRLAEDRRVRTYYLTAAGMAALRDALPVWRRTTKLIEAGLSQSMSDVRGQLDAFTGQIRQAI